MLDFFDNETENGKLYINYPMIESFFHLKFYEDIEYDDKYFEELTCPKTSGKKYKTDVRNKCLRRIPYSIVIHHCDEKLLRKILIHNFKKSNYIVNLKYDILCREELLRINQRKILDNQIKKFIPNGEVCVLNSFSLFLVNYFKEDFYKKWILDKL
ncbi:hypothetical protein [Fusobacterium sp. PH5-44]|uniref:hypothetical protein n=1 Tax=unclassified Fusobacterium TaxID=2648384 RepID=UPI003D196A2F